MNPWKRMLHEFTICCNPGATAVTGCDPGRRCQSGSLAVRCSAVLSKDPEPLRLKNPN